MQRLFSSSMMTKGIIMMAIIMILVHSSSTKITLHPGTTSIGMLSEYSVMVFGLNRQELEKVFVEGRHAKMFDRATIRIRQPLDKMLVAGGDENYFSKFVQQFQKERIFIVGMKNENQVHRLEHQIDEINADERKDKAPIMVKRLYNSTTGRKNSIDNRATKNLLSNHDYVQMTAKLKALNAANPHLSLLFSVGQSVQQRELWVMKLFGTKVIGKPNTNLRYEKPKFKYIANMHGNETVGREVILYFIEYLLYLYNSGDSRVTTILDYMDVFIMPSMNPDGYELKQRRNANNVDLNRNFPDFYFGKPDDPLQPETIAVMNWISQESFSLSANLHGGVVVANYPFDTALSKDCNYSATPDDTFFKNVATVYADTNTVMHLSTRFPGGITNGAQWWVVRHSMADYNYFGANCYELTLELTEEYIAPEDHLDMYWDQNKDALIAYMDQLKYSAVGIVSDDIGNAIPLANVTVINNAKIINSNKNGFFWRLLPPGTFTIQVSKDGYISQNQTVIIPEKPELGKPIFSFFNLKRK